MEVRLTGKSDTLVHAKLLDDTRLCPDADRDGFASSFLDIVTCPRCAPRLAGIQWRLEHHTAEEPPAPVETDDVEFLDLDSPAARASLIALLAIVGALAAAFVAAVVIGQTR